MCYSWKSQMEKYYTKEEDWLKQSRDNEIVYCNPPYWKEIKKASSEMSFCEGVVVMLLPARTDTSRFHDYIYHKSEIRFIRGRLKFWWCKNSAPFPSMLAIYKCPAYMSEENPHTIALTMSKDRTMMWWAGNKVFEVLYELKNIREEKRSYRISFILILGKQQPIKSATKFLFLNHIMMAVLLGLIIRAGQVMAIIVCFKTQSPKWLKNLWRYLSLPIHASIYLTMHGLVI